MIIPKIFSLPYGIYMMKTGSMEPNIKPLDPVVIAKTDDYKVGDIIMFCIYDERITHRIINIDGEIITTKGDASPQLDTSIIKDIVRGKAIAIIPRVIWITILMGLSILSAIMDIRRILNT
jgi:signal peptidase I